jgi:hypothetical protein
MMSDQYSDMTRLQTMHNKLSNEIGGLLVKMQGYSPWLDAYLMGMQTAWEISKFLIQYQATAVKGNKQLKPTLAVKEVVDVITGMLAITLTVAKSGQELSEANLAMAEALMKGNDDEDNPED